MNLSKNLSLSECVKSNTATRKGIPNSPTKEHIDNLKNLAEHIFQPLRDFLNHPVNVSSGYRSKRLNKAIGGAFKIVNGEYVPTSQHCKGEALDLDNDVYNKEAVSNSVIFDFIKENLNFDQLIWEFGDCNNPSWVHVSYVSEAENRNRILVAYKNDQGKTRYKKY